MTVIQAIQTVAWIKAMRKHAEEEAERGWEAVVKVDGEVKPLTEYVDEVVAALTPPKP